MIKNIKKWFEYKVYSLFCRVWGNKFKNNPALVIPFIVQFSNVLQKSGATTNEINQCIDTWRELTGNEFSLKSFNEIYNADNLKYGAVDRLRCLRYFELGKHIYFHAQKN